MSTRQPDVVTVAITRVDGGLTVLRVIENEYGPYVPPVLPEPALAQPNDRVLLRHVDVTPEYVEALIARHVQGGAWTGGQLPVSWRFVPNDFVEAEDRTYRDAWKDGGGARPDHDMPKAREIHRAKLRKLRAPLLEQLDVEYQRADEVNDQVTKGDVAARKQVLRDLTDDPAIEVAQTAADLKTLLLEFDPEKSLTRG